MPKRYTKRSKPRKPYKKKGYKLTRKSDIVIGNNSLVNASKLTGKMPFPRKYICKLIYRDTLGLAGGGVKSSVDTVFRMGSLFDVDLTNVGHQPRYFDQLAELYDRHRVLGVRAKINPLSTNSSIPQQNLFVCLVANNSSASLDNSDFYDIMEQPYTKGRTMNLYTGASPSITGKWSNAKVLGVKSIMYDENYASPNSGYAGKQSYLHVLVGASDGTTTGWSCTAQVEIEFLVQFENPITPPSS